MNPLQPIFIVDDWLVNKHQHVADWAYTQRDDISPYLIAAHLFGATSFLTILYSGYCYSVGVGFSGKEFTTVHIALAFLSLFATSAWFWLSALRHKRWLRKQSTASPNPMVDTFLRVTWIISTLAAVIAFSIDPQRSELLLQWVLWLAQHFAELSAWCFFACNIPTRIERWKPALAPVRT